MAIVVLFNLLVMPWLMERQVKEVDYGTFLSMVEGGQVSKAEISSITKMRKKPRHAIDAKTAGRVFPVRRLCLPVYAMAWLSYASSGNVISITVSSRLRIF